MGGPAICFETAVVASTFGVVETWNIVVLSSQAKNSQCWRERQFSSQKAGFPSTLKSPRSREERFPRPGLQPRTNPSLASSRGLVIPGELQALPPLSRCRVGSVGRLLHAPANQVLHVKALRESQPGAGIALRLAHRPPWTANKCLVRNPLHISAQTELNLYREREGRKRSCRRPPTAGRWRGVAQSSTSHMRKCLVPHQDSVVEVWAVSKTPRGIATLRMRRQALQVLPHCLAPALPSQNYLVSAWDQDVLAKYLLCISALS